MLWGTGSGLQTINKGKIYANMSAAEALKALNITPDFSYKKPQENTNLLYVHRTTTEGEIYWVNNRNDRAENLDAIFRVEGKEAEIWHPETGKTEPASYTIKNGQTIVPLHLEPNDAVFVVFRKNAEGLSRMIPTKTETQVSAINGPWEVSFQADRGAPAKATFETLLSWSENKDSGIKYFSGTGSYTKTVDAPESWFKSGEQLWLDLGEVKNLAEVFVNGKSLGIVWKRPFRIDLSGAMKSGKNTLEVKVTNLWVNRLIGDQQPDVEKKITYTTMPFYQANSPLLSSGLIGPVSIFSVK